MRPELPERLPRLAAGLIAIAAKIRATRNRRIHRTIGGIGELP